jgi:DNA polymerase/3'-5' exonuclease PolX
MFLLKYEIAKVTAESVLGILQPYCERGMVVGSIRRGCAIVHDIDMVLLPAPGRGEELRRAIRALAGAGGMDREGPCHLTLHLREGGAQLDVWLAHHDTADLFAPEPCNYWPLVMSFTGSKAHNILLAQRAKALGGKYGPATGYVARDGRVFAAGEAVIYAAMGLRYLEPREREFSDPREGAAWIRSACDILAI